MKKKGSLNLSIEAIVIVVIAFVVLGLGLGFVRNQFKSFGNLAEDTQGQIKQQLMEDLRTGDKKLSFPSTQYTASSGEEIGSASGVAVKNTGDAVLKFKLEFLVKVGANFESFKSGTTTGTETDFGQFKARIDWDDTEQTLNPGESRFYGIAMSSPNKIGNYLYKIRVTDSEKQKVYDEKTFFIKST
ncbi:hypothetical protein HZC32_03865 [Candidatus Woesearchaeota archaeon]|nr:hypothetical protein [Candidatus Woesearchaeota archaeon]